MGASLKRGGIDAAPASPDVLRVGGGAPGVVADPLGLEMHCVDGFGLCRAVGVKARFLFRFLSLSGYKDAEFRGETVRLTKKTAAGFCAYLGTSTALENVEAREEGSGRLAMVVRRCRNARVMAVMIPSDGDKVDLASVRPENGLRVGDFVVIQKNGAELPEIAGSEPVRGW